MIEISRDSSVPNGVPPSDSAAAARNDHIDWIATGAIACSRAVVWVQPRGPPNSSRTLLMKPRAIDRPTSFW